MIKGWLKKNKYSLFAILGLSLLFGAYFTIPILIILYMMDYLLDKMSIWISKKRGKNV